LHGELALVGKQYVAANHYHAAAAAVHRLHIVLKPDRHVSMLAFELTMRLERLSLCDIHI
jgi:hypothetical protein